MLGTVNSATSVNCTVGQQQRATPQGARLAPQSCRGAQRLQAAATAGPIPTPVGHGWARPGHANGTGEGTLEPTARPAAAAQVSCPARLSPRDGAWCPLAAPVAGALRGSCTARPIGGAVNSRTLRPGCGRGSRCVQACGERGGEGDSGRRGRGFVRLWIRSAGMWS